METGTLLRMTSLIALVGAVGTVGCFTNSEDTQEAETVGSRVNAGGDTSAVLKSTLLLETGCTAAKVGPKVLVTAARCVVGSSKLVSGATVKFAVAAAAAPDAGSKAPARTFVVSDVKIHSSFGARCAGDACAIGKDASDAADVAVIVLEQDLETVPAIPIDLDAVGEADPLLVVASGCSSLAAKDGDGVHTSKTIAVPAKAAAHEGGAYAKVATTKLAQSYVVTPGVGWQDKGIKLCATDIGGPVFRGGSAAITGITSTVTVFDDAQVPVTLQHTRVDAQSRFKIADWLTSFGAQTIHSCSESAGGCQKRSYDGGMPVDPSPTADTTGPDEDAGKVDVVAPDAGPTEEPTEKAGPRTEPVTQDPGPGSDDSSSEEDYGDAAVPSKKVKKQTGGCSAAPGQAPAGDVGLGLGLAIAALVVARRRRSA
jgi:MYXO-CTERM domain-containing protein